MGTNNTPLSPEDVADLRAAVSDVLWKHAQNQANERRRQCRDFSPWPPAERTVQRLDEERAAWFRTCKEDGFDRFVRLMAHMEWLEAQLAAHEEAKR